MQWFKKRHVFIVFLAAFMLSNTGFIYPQNLKQNIKPTISGGAAYIEALHKGLVPKALKTSNQTAPETQQTRVSTNIIGSVVSSINFEQDGSNTGYYHIPPDNAGCAGPSHFLLAVNVSIEWYTKSGTRQQSEDLTDFFSATSPTYGLFDPKVLYDQYNERYVVIALEKDANSQTSNIHIAVSQSNDPNGSWYFQKINSVINIDGEDCWADFPGLGVSNQALYITCNMFDFSSNSFHSARLWILDKGLYSGGSSTVNVYAPSDEVGNGSNQSFTLQPAHAYGSLPGNVGTFLFDTGWYDGSNNDYVEVIRVDDPLGSPSFSQSFINLGDIHDNSAGVPDAPQQGTADKIDFGDNRAQSCVWRDNRLLGAFTVNPVSGTDAGQATAHWIDINTSDLSNLALTQQGNIGGEDIATGTYTSYPSIAVNQDGDVAIGFSASASTIYAGSYFTMHTDDDASGTVETSQTLQSGVDYYYRVFNGTRNRWGDYSSICVDPADDLNFWVFNQYAWTRGSSSGGDGRWATSFANFGTIETPQYLKADQITSTSLQLHWDGRSAEFRLLQDGNEIYAGSDTAYSVTGLSANTSYTFQIYGKASGQNVYSSENISLQVTTEPSGTNDNPTETIASTPTVPSGGGTSEFAVEGTGVWLTFPSGTSVSTSFTAAKKTGDPGIVGSLPSGISKIATDRNWTVTASAGSDVGTYNIRFDLSGMTGIENFNTLKILKRDDASSAWVKVEDLGATYSYNDPYITVSGLSSFSDFAVASTGDNSLPVELTSFSAHLQNGFVVLSWRTESEVENLGFIIERSEDGGKHYLELDDFNSFPDLKGAGNISYARNYSYTDSTIEAGKTYWYRLCDVSINGKRTEHDPISVVIEKQEGALKQIFAQRIPKSVEIYPNFPNPFNPLTNIRFAIPESEHSIWVQLTIYDLNGRKVKTLINRKLNAGIYSIRWDATNESNNKVGSGMYLSVLKVGHVIKTGKMLLMK